MVGIRARSASSIIARLLALADALPRLTGLHLTPEEWELAVKCWPTNPPRLESAGSVISSVLEEIGGKKASLREKGVAQGTISSTIRKLRDFDDLQAVAFFIEGDRLYATAHRKPKRAR